MRGQFFYPEHGQKQIFDPLPPHLVFVYIHTIYIFCLETSLGPKKQGFWPKINCSQMKLPNFVSPSADSLSKIGHGFSKKVVQKLKLPINNQFAPKQLFFIGKKNQKDSDDF